MSHEPKTHIVCEGLLLGNTDLTDDAQEALQQQLLDQEMRQKFPALFATHSPTLQPEEV